MTCLYVSGPMTGLPGYNIPAFNRAAQDLASAGYHVTNPADAGADPIKPWADYLRADLKLLLDCDGIATLPNWDQSRGATLEVFVATQLGLRIHTVAEWVRQADQQNRHGVRPLASYCPSGTPGCSDPAPRSHP